MGKIMRRIDQRNVRECLREISDQALFRRVVFLRKQPEIVAQFQQSLEQPLGLLLSAEQIIGVREPEAAGEEDTLTGRQAVVGGGRLIAPYEAIDEEIAFDRCYRAAHPLVVGWEKANRRNEQQTRIELLGAVGLNK